MTMQIVSLAQLVAPVASPPVSAWRYALWVAIPYAALAIFLVGLCLRLVRWSNSPTPFRIPTACGQQKSLPWIKPNAIDNPSSGVGAVVRMALEILLFRSLFRNSQSQLLGERYIHGESKALWLAALAFHWSLLVIVVRHLRLLVEPAPRFVSRLAAVDGWMQIGVPELYMSDVVVLVAILFLLYRRTQDPIVRYLSRFADFFVLFLILCIAGSGMLMRHFLRVDLVAAKRLAIGLATFHPIVPEGLSAIFLIHLMLICLLAAYFPFSKLVHMGGVFLSPTRNLANNSRARRHINPWNPQVKTHSYAEWEEEFRDKIKAAEIPLNEAEP